MKRASKALFFGALLSLPVLASANEKFCGFSIQDETGRLGSSQKERIAKYLEKRGYHEAADGKVVIEVAERGGLEGIGRSTILSRVYGKIDVPAGMYGYPYGYHFQCDASEWVMVKQGIRNVKGAVPKILNRLKTLTCEQYLEARKKCLESKNIPADADV